MPGVALKTSSRHVQPAGGVGNNDVWITFNLTHPLALQTPVIGPDGKAHPAGFVMFELNTDDAAKLAKDIQEVVGEQIRVVTEFSHVANATCECFKHGYAPCLYPAFVEVKTGESKVLMCEWCYSQRIRPGWPKEEAIKAKSLVTPASRENET